MGISLNKFIKLKLFLNILTELRYSILLLFLTCSVFIIVLLLYSVSIDAILYALILSMFFWIIFIFYFYFKTKAKHETLTRIMDQDNFIFDQLNVPSNFIEKDYYTIIEKIVKENLTNQTNASNKYNNLQDITTIWAHQIKTPISAMRLLLQTDESKDNHEISDELFEIEKYVEMLLGYYRINSETNDFVIRKINCEPIIRSVIRQYAKYFIRKKLLIEVSDIDVMVISDEKWLGFVIEQIISNAIKYTHEGKIRISFENRTTLVIEDTGIGIQEEDLPRIFEKGYTGYNGRNDKKSTGLGLYLCKNILNKLGHTIKIESSLNKGTMVKINLESVKLSLE